LARELVPVPVQALVLVQEPERAPAQEPERAPVQEPAQAAEHSATGADYLPRGSSSR
jgi:hypothetical protein